MAPPRRALFLDCDDTLYHNDFRTAELLTLSIGSYCVKHLGISVEKSFQLYKEHGTCLKGLEAEGIPHDAAHFLDQVHMVDLDFGEDAHLREILGRLDHSAHEVRVFTASVASHAQRCLERLGVHDLLVTPERTIIDVHSVGMRSKHHAQAFSIAQAIAQQPEPSGCTLVDDNWTNIRAAKAAGWRTVLCGSVSRYGEAASELKEADWVISSIHELEAILPEFFVAPPGPAAQ
ncbi:Haloacid dehalogenase-like hydrolase [Pavlovales sp. CCMP2436]|nr:Haloacid dehalogenase-like hydrolase [Pavlovales sp. CCMP2436]